MHDHLTEDAQLRALDDWLTAQEQLLALKQLQDAGLDVNLIMPMLAEYSLRALAQCDWKS